MSLTVSELVGLQTSKYFDVAGVTILIFQYATTLDEEVQWMWGRSWDVTRVVFMVSRYMPFLATGFIGYNALHTNSQPCESPLQVGGDVTTRLSIIASEVLLVLRTYAFWQGDKRVLYGLLAYACVSIAASVPFSVMQENLIFPEQPLDGTCLLVASRNTTFVYLILLLFELVILFLMIYKHVRTYRGMGRSGIVYTLYRDGIFYIISIALVTFTNVLLDGIFPLQYSSLLALPQVVLHSVLASRIMFNIRKSYYRVQVIPEITAVSDARALSDFVCRAGLGHAQSDSVTELDTQHVTYGCVDVDGEV